MQGPMVAKMHLGKDVREVKMDPFQCWLPDDVLPRGDHHKLTHGTKTLQACKCACIYTRFHADKQGH